MTVILRHNEQLEVNRVDYSGSVTMDELRLFAAFNAGAPTWVTYDSLSLVLPGTDFRTVNLAELDALFGHYRGIYQPINMLIMRRSAWLCQSPVAERHVHYWTGGRDAKEAMSSDMRVFVTVEAAAEWLLLRPHETEKLKTGEGFAEIFRADTRAAALQR